MKQSQKTVYQCDHCNKKYFVKSACEKHEQWCHKNPENKKACSDCKFCKTTTVEHHSDSYFGQNTQMVPIVYCQVKLHYLIPLSSQRKGNAYLMEDLGDGDIENLPMPKECDKYKCEYESFNLLQ